MQRHPVLNIFKMAIWSNGSADSMQSLSEFQQPFFLNRKTNPQIKWNCKWRTHTTQFQNTAIKITCTSI